MTIDHPTLANHTDKTPQGGRPRQIDVGEICELIREHGYQESSLINILQDIQTRMNFLPRKALGQLSESPDIPLPQIYAIAAFYKAFTLEPRSRHTTEICLGTASHVRGSGRILDDLENRLNIGTGATTKDLQLHELHGGVREESL
jgi:NADH-quinone oxidoreductase subunit E